MWNEGYHFSWRRVFYAERVHLLTKNGQKKNERFELAEEILLMSRARGPFLESPGNFTGPKSNIQIEK